MEEKEELAPLTLRQKFLLINMCVIAFCTYITVALIGPFFPGVAQEKGASITEVGLIFSVYNIGVFSGALFWGNFVSTIGPKFLYISGMVIRGGSDLLFGFLENSPNGPIFVIMCMVVRIFEAIGASMFSTAMWTIVAREFPGRIPSTFGTLQLFTGVGLMMGPPIGGALFDLGGFKTPFIVFGGLMLAVALTSYFTLPSTMDEEAKGEKNKKQWMFSLLQYFSIDVNMITVLFFLAPIVYLEVALEGHLSQFGLSPTAVGLYFVFETAAYAGASPFWGFFNKRYCYPRVQMLIGCFFYGLACLLMGPSPWFPSLSPQLWRTALSLVMVGIGGSALNVAAFTDTLTQTLRAGYPDNFDTYGLVAGLYQFCVSFGGFIGPTIGSPLQEAYGFPFTISCIGVGFGCLAVFIITAKYFESRAEKRGRTLSIFNVPQQQAHTAAYFQTDNANSETVSLIRSKSVTSGIANYTSNKF